MGALGRVRAWLIRHEVGSARSVDIRVLGRIAAPQGPRSDLGREGTGAGRADAGLGLGLGGDERQNAVPFPMAVVGPETSARGAAVWAYTDRRERLEGSNAAISIWPIQAANLSGVHPRWITRSSHNSGPLKVQRTSRASSTVTPRRR